MPSAFLLVLAWLQAQLADLPLGYRLVFRFLLIVSFECCAEIELRLILLGDENPGSTAF